MSYVVLNSGMASLSAGHSTIFASFALHCAPNTTDPAAVIRSTTCTGGTKGAIAGCGISRGGIAGATEAVGLIRLFSGISVSLFAKWGISRHICNGDRAADKGHSIRRRPDADCGDRYLGGWQDHTGTQNRVAIGVAAHRAGRDQLAIGVARSDAPRSAGIRSPRDRGHPSRSLAGRRQLRSGARQGVATCDTPRVARL